jgi:hypothetical protein
MTMTSTFDPRRLSNDELLAQLRQLVCRTNALETDLIEHVAEVDERRLYLEWAHPSLFAFLTEELGFSEAVAQNRILVARASRRFPRMLALLRQGQIHTSGLRLLAPHLTEQNSEALFAQAVGKTKRQIEELLASHFPCPAVPDQMRKLPERRMEPEAEPKSAPPAPAEPHRAPLAAPPEPLLLRPAPSERRPSVEPLSAEQFKVQFTADRALRDKLRQAQDLLRHQVPDGSLAVIIERAIELLLREVKKQRFGLGRKPKEQSRSEAAPSSRHVPAAIRRAVYQRDGGQCSFVDPRGHRCPERGFLEIDHVQGFARTRAHSVDACRLLCKLHNQYAADLLYGHGFMEQKRKADATLRQGGPASADADGSG